MPVVTRTMHRALQDRYDIVIVDTSGRLSNNFELIEQLQNMKAAMQAVIPQAPHETLLVVDGSVGTFYYFPTCKVPMKRSQVEMRWIRPKPG